MTAKETELQKLKQQHPEWQPWLTVVEAIVSESENPSWDAFVPPGDRFQQNRTPLLAGTTLVVERGLIERAVQQIFTLAQQSGTPKMATLKGVTEKLNPLALLKASVCLDSDAIKSAAARIGADPNAFEAVAALLAHPLLHGCNRRWSSFIAGSWSEGYCPICGTWPAFAELRGIERSRFYRCVRCGCEWQSHCLSCPYCAVTDHNQLVSLVSEKSNANHSVDACNRCLGYVKIFATLERRPAGRLMIDDLATVPLDLAAMERGYKRPSGAGFNLDVSLLEDGAADKLSI